MNTSEEHFLGLLDDVLAMVRKHGLSDRHGQRLFEAAMEGFGTWRVESITHEAARTLIESGFNTKLVCRAHRVSRLETFIALRDRVPRSKAFAFYLESDRTTLTTKTENGRHGVEHWSVVYPLPATLGELRATFGVRFTKTQKAALAAAFADVLRP